MSILEIKDELFQYLGKSFIKENPNISFNDEIFKCFLKSYIKENIDEIKDEIFYILFKSYILDNFNKSIEKIDDGILCHFIELSIKKTNDYELFTSYIKYLASHNKFYKAFSVFTYFYFMKDNNQRTIYEKRQIVNTFIDLVKSFKKFNE